MDDLHDEEQSNFQQVITLRMRELAYNKILVMTYEKSYFRLVQALFHIGKEYLRFDCYEQASEHLKSAISKHVQSNENSSKALIIQSTDCITHSCCQLWGSAFTSRGALRRPKNNSKRRLRFKKIVKGRRVGRSITSRRCAYWPGQSQN